MDWLADVYLICAVVGGTILVVQTILLAVGTSHGDADLGHDTVGGDHDVGHDAGDAAFVKWLSLKTGVAALTFFGLAGLAGQKAGLSAPITLVLALAAGTAALVIVAFLMASLSRLQSRGNLDLQNAVGRPARVHLRIPGARQGRGKVTLEVQGRFLEVEAVTAGAELPTGMDVRVVAVSGDAVEVAKPVGG
jgi:membrane protein implicated in regulation of membrane protease activity